MDRRDGDETGGGRKRPLPGAVWAVLIPHHLPGLIGWPTGEMNRRYGSLRHDWKMVCDQAPGTALAREEWLTVEAAANQPGGGGIDSAPVPWQVHRRRASHAGGSRAHSHDPTTQESDRAGSPSGLRGQVASHTPSGCLTPNHHATCQVRRAWCGPRPSWRAEELAHPHFRQPTVVFRTT